MTVDTAAPNVPVIATFATDGMVAMAYHRQRAGADGRLRPAPSCRSDGATLLGSATANASGAWSFATATLSDGVHAFTARATDAAANTSATSAALTVTVDTVAPTVPTESPSRRQRDCRRRPHQRQRHADWHGGGQQHHPGCDGTTLLGSVTANASGAWSFATATLADGAHGLTARATDAAGNTSAASASLAVTVDTTAPTVPVIAAFSNDSGIAGDGITNINHVTLTGLAEANSTVVLYDGATLLGTATANASGAWSSATATLADGAHAFTAKATDTAGNISAASAALNMTVDTAAPVVDQTTAVPSTGIEFPSDTVTVTLNLSEVVTVAGTPTLALNSGGTASYFSGSGTDTLTFIYTVGPNDTTVPSLTITAVNLPAGATMSDAAGNTADLSGALVTFPDLQIDPPGTPVISSYSADSGTAGDGITNDDTLTLTGTATANSTVTVYDGATSLGSTTTNSSGTWSFSTPTLTAGAHDFTVTETVAGNTSAASTAQRHHRHRARGHPALPRTRPTVARWATTSPVTTP